MFAKIIVWIAGLGLIGFGGMIAIAPVDSFAAMGLPMPDEAAYRIELRAFYGGLELGLGALLVYCALNAVRGGLWLVIATFGAVGVVRGVAMALEGYAAPLFWFALATELGLAALAAIALNRGSAKS